MQERNPFGQTARQNNVLTQLRDRLNVSTRN